MDPAAGHWTEIVFLGYILAVFGLAFASHRVLNRREFMADYFLGGRSLGPWTLAMTYAATSASAGSLTGFPALIYQHGWIVALWIAGYMVGPLCALGLFGKRINQVARKSGAITLPDLLRNRYGSPMMGVLTAAVLIVFLGVYLVAQFKAGGVIVQVLLRDAPWFQRLAERMAWLPARFDWTGPANGSPSPAYCLSLLIFSASVIVYTAYGGFRAVVWTDVLQGLVMMVGVLLLLFYALSAAGGMEAATRHLIRETPPAAAPGHNYAAGPGFDAANIDGFLPIGLAISFFLFWPITGAGQPGTLVRLMAFKNTQAYRGALAAVSVYNAFLYVPLIFIFVCSRSILPPLNEPDQAMPRLVTAVAPVFLAGVLLAAPFAAIMSTVDSFLLMIGSSLSRDIYQRALRPGAPARNLRRVSYAATLAAGAAVTLAAMDPPRLLQDLVVFASTGLACCFLVPVAMALYVRRSTAAGAAAALAGGLLSTVALYAVNWFAAGAAGPYNLLGLHPALWGIAVSFAAGLTVNRLTRPPDESLLAKVY